VPFSIGVSWFISTSKLVIHKIEIVTRLCSLLGKFHFEYMDMLFWHLLHEMKSTKSGAHNGSWLSTLQENYWRLNRWLVIGWDAIHNHVDKAVQWYVLFQNTQLYSMFPHIVWPCFAFWTCKKQLVTSKCKKFLNSHKNSFTVVAIMHIYDVTILKKAWHRERTVDLASITKEDMYSD